MSLRPLITAIPHVGASIDGLVASPATRTAECSLLFLFVELHREMRALDGSSIREEFLDTAEWAGLVRRAVARAAQTRDCKRLCAIARILAAAATGTVSVTVDVQPGGPSPDAPALYC